jgi:sortase A
LGVRPDSRRLLLVLVVGLFVSGGGAIVIQRADEPARATVEDNPVQAVAEATTTTSAAAPPPPAGGPVSPPADPYAAEPIVELGTIEIPKIKLVHRLYHGISLRNIDKGPSHWPGTAMPGETGNIVIAGHRVTHSHPFRHIDRLVAGDEVVFTVNGARTVYLVTESFVVTPKQIDIVNPTPTATGTLFACHPPGSARQRYVVRLVLADR